MAERSPAAEAVLAAFNERHELCGPFDDDWAELCIAAALLAAANQVAPLSTNRRQTDIRAKLRAIAIELDGHLLDIPT